MRADSEKSEIPFFRGMPVKGKSSVHRIKLKKTERIMAHV